MTSPQHAAPGQRFDSYAEFYQNSAYAVFPQEHRTIGSHGLTMMDVRQDAFELIDPPVPEYVFISLPNLSGRGFVDFGDGVKAVENPSPNMLQVTPAWTESHCGVDRPHRILAAAVPKATIDHLLDGYNLGENVFSSFYAPGISAPRATAMMDVMWRYSNAPGGAASLYLDGAMLQFLALVADHAAMSPLAPDRPEDVRIARVIDYIETHYGEALTIGELATIACLSPGHFSRTFKATVGQPVWTYVQHRRCERAKELLQFTDLPIAEIAYRCGFANQAHLTTSFKKYWDATPGIVRGQ